MYIQVYLYIYVYEGIYSFSFSHIQSPTVAVKGGYFPWALPFGTPQSSAQKVSTFFWHSQALTVPGKSSAPCRD